MKPNQIYNINEKYFENIDNEEKAYWLGFLYADGCVRFHKKRSGHLKLKLKQSDKKWIEKFNLCLNSTYPIKDGMEILKHNNKEYKCFYSVVNIYNTKMVKDLYNLGCMNNKTQKIRLPELNIELMRHFIRGYFDGDGCISKMSVGYNCYGLSIVSNTNFILDVKKHLEDIFDANFSYKQNKKYSVLIISDRENRENFYHYIYKNSTIYLERKKKIFDDMMIIKDVKRKGNTNIKKYKIIDPSGKIFYTDKGLVDFCKERNLNHSSINNVLRKTTNNYKGWFCELV